MDSQVATNVVVDSTLDSYLGGSLCGSSTRAVGNTEVGDVPGADVVDETY